MWTGSVAAIYVRPEKSGATMSVVETEAVPGKGLAGDWLHAEYADKDENPEPKRHVTLIESEAIEGAAKEYNLQLDASETRRNIVTRDTPLNHLIGREFVVGEATLLGIKLCEPCGHLEKLTRPGVRQALVHRGGLRARILVGGTIRVGDGIEERRP